jgi:hypothetical protein
MSQEKNLHEQEHQHQEEEELRKQKLTNTKKMKNFMNRSSPTPGRKRQSN